MSLKNTISYNGFFFDYIRYDLQKKALYEIIKNFQDNYFNFENVYFDINSTINKINYYIDNNFNMDKKMNEFYDEFNFTRGPIINDFIDSLFKI